MLIIRTRRPFYRSVPGPVLLWLTLAVGALTFALPYAGLVAAPFDLQPLPAAVLGALLAITAGYVAATELAKHRFYRNSGEPGTHAS
jgi:Mg2+-importing ATPase